MQRVLTLFPLPVGVSNFVNRGHWRGITGGGKEFFFGFWLLHLTGLLSTRFSLAASSEPSSCCVHGQQHPVARASSGISWSHIVWNTSGEHHPGEYFPWNPKKQFSSKSIRCGTTATSLPSSEPGLSFPIKWVSALAVDQVGWGGSSLDSLSTSPRGDEALVSAILYSLEFYSPFSSQSPTIPILSGS